MGLFLVVFVFMLILVAAMSVGVLLGRKPIAGTCGGMSALGMETACDICGGDKTKCEKESAETDAQKAAKLSYDATQTK
jgi:uncharacterized protein